MALLALDKVIDRISTAPRQRAISVFIVTKNKKRYLDVYYADTLEAIRRKNELMPEHFSDTCSECGQTTRRHRYEWIGDFHNEMNLGDAEAYLTVSLEA